MSKDRAEELYDQIKQAMWELNDIFRREGGLTYQRWKSYPYGHIVMALDNEHDYLGKNMFTVQGLIDDLEDDDESDDDDCSPPANEIDSIEDEVREP